MANSQEQKAIDKAEVAARRYEARAQACRNEYDETQEHPEMGQPISSIRWTDKPPVSYGEIQVLHHIKAGLCRNGTFKAVSMCGAKISLHIDSVTGDLVLVVEGPGSKFESWMIKR